VVGLTLLAFFGGSARPAVAQGARGSNVVIVRGLHTAALNGSGSGRNDSVASYLGDVPLPIDLRLRDIARVEVLLGPQGTLYGAGTLAGAVRYLPRRPDPGERACASGSLFGERPAPPRYLSKQPKQSEDGAKAVESAEPSASAGGSRNHRRVCSLHRPFFRQHLRGFSGTRSDRSTKDQGGRVLARQV
jgi:hypothetical protein